MTRDVSNDRVKYNNIVSGETSPDRLRVTEGCEVTRGTEIFTPPKHFYHSNNFHSVVREIFSFKSYFFLAVILFALS